MKRFLSALIVFIPALAMAADPKVDARAFPRWFFRLITALSRSIIFSLANLSIGPSDPLTPVNHN